MKYKQLIPIIALATASIPIHATVVDLDFSNHIEDTNLNNSFGPSYDGPVMHFLNVGVHNGKTIDAKISSRIIGDATFLYHTHLIIKKVQHNLVEILVSSTKQTLQALLVLFILLNF
nr:hypothetical protein [Aliivibrio fischeri]